MAFPTSVAVGTLAFLAFWGDHVSPALYQRSDDRATLTVGRRLQWPDRAIGRCRNYPGNRS